MDNQRQSNGWQTFLEHWGFALTGVLGLIASQIFTFFMRLRGAPWIWCYALGLFVAALGIALLFYAKLPLYRERRFFTFGSRALLKSSRSFYHCGYRCMAFATVLLLCLLLSRP